MKAGSKRWNSILKYGYSPENCGDKVRTDENFKIVSGCDFGDIGYNFRSVTQYDY